MSLNTIQNSLKNGISYAEYRAKATEIVAQGKSSGNDQSQEYIDFSKLNESRMNRLDKTIVILPEVKNQLQNLSKNYIWLVLSETWCGDAAQQLPIFNKMAEVSNKIELKIVFRDQNEDLMNMFLTNGGKSIPKIIILDAQTHEVINHYGPRPQGAAQLVIDYKAKHGVIDETIKENLQLWYLHDKGESTQKAIMELMKN
jgi:hypothetical protein